MTEQVEAAMKIPDERVQKVGAFTGLTEDQVKRFVGCLLAVGLEIVESSKLPIPVVEEKAAPSTPAGESKTLSGRSKDEWLAHIETLFEIARDGEDIPFNALLAWTGKPTEEDIAWVKKNIAKPQPDSIPEQTFEEWWKWNRYGTDRALASAAWNAAKGSR